MEQREQKVGVDGSSCRFENKEVQMSKSEREELLEEYGQYEPVVFVEFIGIDFMKSSRGKGGEYDVKDKHLYYACIGIYR